MHIGFSTMDAKVNDTKIVIKKLVLDPNMNRGLALGVGSSGGSGSNTSSSRSSSSAPTPPQPKPAAKGRSSKLAPKCSTQSRLAFNEVVDPTVIRVYFTRSDDITVPFSCLFPWPGEYRE